MPPIPGLINKVPMMYRAQVDGRCQLQRLRPKAEVQDAELWVREWTERTYPQPPSFGPGVQTRTYRLSWRFVTNGGQDDGIIRPVVGARGWPFYPGSSMKGLFRSACTPAQAARYCGRALPGGDWAPGILRFHGGYPTSDRWRDKLLDLVHPQQDYQVKRDNAHHAAFLMVSLYQPELCFGISSTEPLSDQEWAEIWDIWERALAKGIGSRVCAGYGHPATLSGDELYPPHKLHGQGMASQTLDGYEFRPNMFRAALRGHALRIFGGLVPAEVAEQEVEQLFGGLGRREPVVGLVGMKFVTDRLLLKPFGQGAYRVETYEVTGQLSWLLTRSLPESDREALKQFLLRLTQFAMILGGFGKSWRRADHRLFYPNYYQRGNRPYIGCHWQWLGNQGRDVQVLTPGHVGKFINDRLLPAARQWLAVRGIRLNQRYADTWRESWHPDKVQVWARPAENKNDSLAIEWFHRPYNQGQSIKNSALTGRLGRIGRIWHRMYPQFAKDPQTNQISNKSTGRYIELLTIFPDNSDQCRRFLRFLQDLSDFERVWPR